MIYEPLNPLYWAWFMERNPIPFTTQTKGIGVRTPEGAILAVVVFDNWSYNGAKVHLVIDSIFVLRNYKFLNEIYEYIFVQCDKKYLLAEVPAHNKRSLAFCEKVGFSTVYVIEDGYRDNVDLHVLMLKRDEYGLIQRRA